MKTVRIKSMEGSVVGERYQAIKRIRADAVKSTYSCRDINETKKRLVLKTIDTSRSFMETTEKWSRDFSLLHRFRNPELVRILDFGKVENSNAVYFVEEWTEGKDFYRGTEGLGIERILDLLDGLYQTVRYLHRRKIVHGALKPSNIFLKAMPQELFSLTLTDYGMAGFHRNGDSIPDGFNGMLPYSAPELLLGKSPDIASDLYSLGILTYLVLTRRLPFEDADPGFLMQKHLQGSADMRPIGRLAGGSDLVRLLAGFLEKNPEKRFSSLDEKCHISSGKSFMIRTGVFTNSMAPQIYEFD